MASGYTYPELEHLISEEEDNIKTLQDAVIIFIHWCLIKFGFSYSDLESKNETSLPEGWNKQPYLLEYEKENKKYNVTCSIINGDFIVNLRCLSTNKTTGVKINLKKYVKKRRGTEKFTDIPKLSQIVESCLIIPQKLDMRELSQKLEKCLTLSEESNDDFGKVTNNNNENTDSSRKDARQDPQAVGKADLDPLAKGGGMIFDPFSVSKEPDHSLGLPEKLPKGSVPPGANFDPFGIPDPDPPRRKKSDPDSSGYNGDDEDSDYNLTKK